MTWIEILTRMVGRMSEVKTSDSKTHWTSLDAMRPTQCAVGYLEVDLKMQELRERAQDNGNLAKYLKTHPIPAVLGPDGRMYLTDHHHMGLALIRLSDEWDNSEQPAAHNPYRMCSFEVVKDLSDRHDLSMPKFFSKLEEHHLCHPFDGQGHRVKAIPKYLTELVDDPYRSLAGLARKAGAYDKVNVPFTARGPCTAWLPRAQTRVCAAHLGPYSRPIAKTPRCRRRRTRPAQGGLNPFPNVFQSLP